jgi:CBS domain-containing protein
MRCDQIMKTDVQFATEEQTVEEAARRMREHNIGFLPVCSGSGDVIGTITDRDITIRVTAEGRPASTRIDQAMSHEVIACRPEDDLSLAERLMANFKKSRVLVTDDARKLKGVISLSDIAERESGERAAATLREVAGREARL